MAYGLTQSTPPTGTALEMEQVKRHLRLWHGHDDAYIRDVLMPAAMEIAEAATGRQLLTAVWQLTLDCFPRGRGPLLVPRPPLDSLAIDYVDAAGTTQTLDAADYRVHADRAPAEVLPAFGETWPPVRSVSGAVTVTFTAGYGATHADIPAGLKAAMHFVVGHLYANRESVIVMNSVQALEVPQSARELFERFAVGDWFHHYDTVQA